MVPHEHDHKIADDVDRTTDSIDQAQLKTLEEMLHDLPPLPESGSVTEDSECQRIVALVEQIGLQPRDESPPDAELPSLDLQQLGQYKLLAKLGEGGMGAVYKALHTRLNRLVALKVLPTARMQDAAAVARFDREMRAVGALAHENIVAAHDAGEIAGTHYLVMELVHGVDLGTIARQQAPLPVADACEIIRQAALGLQHAYENNLVHRDIKPSNLMLAEGPNSPVVKILDMGLALLDEQHTEHPDLTASGQIMGTLDYMAPEQAGDTHTVDIRADIYSLGATLYKLLTGRVPFQGPKYNSTVKKLMALATQDPPRVDSFRDDLPADLVDVVHRMLAREPEDRYATPQQVVEAVAAFTAGANLVALLETAAAIQDDAVQTVQLQTSAKGAPSVSVRSSVVETQSQVAPRRSHQPQVQPASPTRPPARWKPGVLIAFAGVPLLLGVILLWLRTPHGEIVVELDDNIPAEAAKNLKIEIAGNGQVKVIDVVAGWTIDIVEGKYQAKLAGGTDQFQLEQNQVTVTRGEQAILRISIKPPGDKLPPAEQASVTPAAPTAATRTWQPTPQQQAFFDHVAKLPAEQQAKAVADKLKEVNPGLDGKMEHKIKDGHVESFTCRSVQLADIWPIRALSRLRTLSCGGQPTSRAKFFDLSPLQGMALEVLDCNGSSVADLSSLRGMPLTYLNCHATSISDLSPLRGAPLTRLSVSRSQVEDLTPLSGMQLTYLDTHATKIKDLTPLKGMPLTRLECGGAFVKDLSPLKGMALTYFDGDGSPIEDLSPLEGMPLYFLQCANTKVRDISPVRGMPLVYFSCWKTDVTDISPLAGMRLSEIDIHKAPISDLSVLADMPLRKFGYDVRLFDEGDFALIQTLPITNLNGPPPFSKRLEELETRQQDALAFAEATYKLPPAEQIKAVAAKLEALNEQGTVRLHAQPNEGGINNVIVTIKDHHHGNARDITPLMALKQLRTLHIVGGEKYMDISCIKFLTLEDLYCDDGIVFKNFAVLKTVQSLKRINGYPADEHMEYVAYEGLRHFAKRKRQIPWEVTPEQQAFFDHVVTLPAEQQAEAVAKKLMEINPGFDGAFEKIIHNGQVIEFTFVTDKITTPTTDLWPVRAFPALRRFWCRGSANRGDHGTYNGNESDLGQLRGMQLMSISIKDAPIKDLSPLGAMPLTHLACYRTTIADLSPLKGMPLDHLQYDVRLFDEQDEAILRSLPLRMVNGTVQQGQPVEEFFQQIAQRREAAQAFAAEASLLPPLKRIAAVQARLEALNLGKPVRLKHNLEGEQLVDVEVYLTGHEVDLTPLMALTDLKRLVLNNCLPWQDTSCVKFLPLEELIISEDAAYKNHRTLRAIKTLRTINGTPATQLWQKLGVAEK